MICTQHCKRQNPNLAYGAFEDYPDCISWCISCLTNNPVYFSECGLLILLQPLTKLLKSWTSLCLKHLQDLFRTSAEQHLYLWARYSCCLKTQFSAVRSFSGVPIVNPRSDPQGNQGETIELSTFRADCNAWFCLFRMNIEGYIKYSAPACILWLELSNFSSKIH